VYVNSIFSGHLLKPGDMRQTACSLQPLLDYRFRYMLSLLCISSRIKKYAITSATTAGSPGALWNGHAKPAPSEEGSSCELFPITSLRVFSCYYFPYYVATRCILIMPTYIYGTKKQVAGLPETLPGNEGMVYSNIKTIFLVFSDSCSIAHNKPANTYTNVLIFNKYNGYFLLSPLVVLLCTYRG